MICLVAALSLTACDKGQPVPTATENEQLDEAADMLDEAPERLSNIPVNELDQPDNASE